MVLVLGGRCVLCGCQENLTFDCIVPQGHAHHRSGTVARVLFYRLQMRAGNLQLLCLGCNSRKGANPMPRYTPFVCPDVQLR